MPPVINNLVATTEVEAVNQMLASIGEAPLAAGTDLSTVTQEDVVMAVNILRNVTRAVQAMGWKFNSEFGYEVAPAAQYSWVDTGGITTPLHIYTPPTGLIAFSITPIAEQQGLKFVDTELRPSRKYTPGTQVFYDRARARDGFPQSERSFLYINPIWLFDFEKMPESARAYCAARAARAFTEQPMGSGTLSEFATRDELVALRTLKREQGNNDDYHILQNISVLNVRGRRPGLAAGVFDPRKNRNST